ncbi:hypothetical protein ANN_27145 [Periplaneta americana]|uniref:Uncharacterized protein n=1 Tax=Periplaneta americana TaxID=6978 RepID=A0ABQ8RXC4_PERAM|nr:hypothetical protein ANN_27145 [Periplaneta americana]
MDAEETVLNRIENKSLKRFGHLMRMGEDRWPKQIYQWKPPGRRGKGRPKKLGTTKYILSKLGTWGLVSLNVAKRPDFNVNKLPLPAQRYCQVCYKSGSWLEQRNDNIMKLVAPPLVAITAATLSGMLSTSLCRISIGKRRHSSCNMALGQRKLAASPETSIAGPIRPKVLNGIEIRTLCRRVQP